MNQPDQHEVFQQWVAAHSAILHRVANGFAAAEDRSDLMQELLLAIWKAIPAFRGDSQPSTFIYRVSHNAALTWKRTRQTYQRKVDRLESFAPPESEPTTTDERGLLEFLYTEIRRLSPVDRSMILLSLDGISYREMARIHGLTESNVGARLTRLKQKLSKSMKGHSHELR